MTEPNENEEQEDATPESEPEADTAETTGDAEAAPEAERSDSVTITSRGWFNRRPPKRRR